MFVNNLLSNSRHLLQRNVTAFRKAGEGTRSCHVVAVPPREKVPKGEVAALTLIITTSIWFIPFWVLYHIPDYQKEDRNKYTGK